MIRNVVIACTIILLGCTINTLDQCPDFDKNKKQIRKKKTQVIIDMESEETRPKY
ncbi:MAG TPA: hypothetical protein VIK89_07130 [Cytophagaceae bacterium]